MKLNFIIRETGNEFQEWPEYRIDTSDGKTVAEVFGKKNVQLGIQMAAAPEMLAALQAIDRCLNEPSLIGPNGSMHDKVRAAIAKAEGKS